MECWCNESIKNTSREVAGAGVLGGCDVASVVAVTVGRCDHMDHSVLSVEEGRESDQGHPPGPSSLHTSLHCQHFLLVRFAQFLLII